jgi:hypothetical protein
MKVQAGASCCGATAKDDHEDNGAEVEDTDAVTCPDFRLIAILRALLTPTPSFVASALVMVVVGSSYVSVAAWAERPSSSGIMMTTEARRLLWVMAACFAPCGLVYAAVVDATRTATRRGGALDYLGVGRTKISEKEYGALKWWARTCTVLAILGIIGALLMLFQPVSSPSGPSWCRASRCDWNAATHFHNMALAVGFAGVCGPVCLASLLSLHVAATLARDAIQEVAKRIQAVDLKSGEAWQRVEKGALHLAKDIMPCLSDGWGPMVLYTFVMSWSLAFGVLAEVIITDSVSGKVKATLGGMAIAFYPFAMAWPLAATSTQCSKLLEDLNQKRMADLSEHERLYALETALRQLNNGKGLGFIVLGG